MAGNPNPVEILNDTLEMVSKILTKHNINDWFIMFGTLVGIARDNSCVPGDDDLDIMIHHDYDQLRTVLESEGYTFDVEHSKHGIRTPGFILKTDSTPRQCSIDFYMCETSGKDFYSPWERTWVRNVYQDATTKTYVQKTWRGTKLNLPNDHDKKLTHMYGDWKIPVAGKKSIPGNDIP